MVPLRYLLAVAIAGLMVAAGFAVSRHLHRSFLERVRQQFRAQAAAGKLPKELEGVDLETATLEGFDIRVNAGDMIRIQIADVISHLWFVWIPLVMGACLGVAWLFGPPPLR